MRAECSVLRVPSAAECLLRVAVVRWALKLAGYERTHAARPEVLGMFERRMAKLAGMED